jgi:hypothetical protein
MKVIGPGPHTLELIGLALATKAVASMRVIGMVPAAALITSINGTRTRSVTMAGTTNTKITVAGTNTKITATDTDASKRPIHATHFLTEQTSSAPFLIGLSDSVKTQIPST